MCERDCKPSPKDIEEAIRTVRGKKKTAAEKFGVFLGFLLLVLYWAVAVPIACVAGLIAGIGMIALACLYVLWEVCKDCLVLAAILTYPLKLAIYFAGLQPVGCVPIFCVVASIFVLVKVARKLSKD